MSKLKIGDEVVVDLRGLYLAFCEGCEEETLAIPGADSCAYCGSKELLRLRDIDFETDIDE